MPIIGLIIICLSRPIDRLKESLYLSDANILSLESHALKLFPTSTSGPGRSLNSQPPWQPVFTSGGISSVPPTSGDGTGTRGTTGTNNTSVA